MVSFREGGGIDWYWPLSALPQGDSPRTCVEGLYLPCKSAALSPLAQNFALWTLISFTHIRKKLIFNIRKKMKQGNKTYVIRISTGDNRKVKNGFPKSISFPPYAGSSDGPCRGSVTSRQLLGHVPDWMSIVKGLSLLRHLKHMTITAKTKVIWVSSRCHWCHIWERVKDDCNILTSQYCLNILKFPFNCILKKEWYHLAHRGEAPLI